MLNSIHHGLSHSWHSQKNLGAAVRTRIVVVSLLVLILNLKIRTKIHTFYTISVSRHFEKEFTVTEPLRYGTPVAAKQKNGPIEMYERMNVRM